MMSAESGRAALAAAAWVILAQSPAAKAANDAPVDFDILSQPMAAALNAWAVQANAQLFVDPGPVAHLTAPAVKGNLPPRQALRALLSHSNLQVTQGANGVYLIKPRPAVAVATNPVPTPEPQIAPPVPPPAPPPTARGSEGPWLLRFDTDFVRGGGGVPGSGTAMLGGEYFFSDHVTGGVTVTLPRTDSFGTAGARLQTYTMTLKYYLASEQSLRPYVGAGMAITALYARTGAGSDHAVVGPAIGAGLDLRLDRHWMLNADVSWAQARPGVVRVDPVRVGFGAVYRF